MTAQPMEWSDLPIFLAIAREGTLGRAARKLGQSQPTMGRRLRALEAATGLTLFQRTADGFILTDDGAIMLRHVERMEADAQALSRALAGSSGGLAGMLRLTCSDWFGRIVLAPMLAEFHRRHPGVIVETLTDQRVYSLSRREADLVFRITGFDEPEVIARRLMTVPYAVYGQVGRWRPRAGAADPYPVVVMDTAFGAMPDVGWLLQTLPGARIAARSNSREIQAELCALGTGLAVLPRPLGDSIRGIEALDLGVNPPTRDTWLGYHRDLKRLPRLRALVELMIERLSCGSTLGAWPAPSGSLDHAESRGGLPRPSWRSHADPDP